MHMCFYKGIFLEASDFLLMKYGTGAPGQVGWAVDFLEILLRVFWVCF